MNEVATGMVHGVGEPRLKPPGNATAALWLYDSGSSLTGVVSLLDQLGRGLAAKYGGGGDEEHPTDLTEEPA